MGELACADSKSTIIVRHERQLQELCCDDAAGVALVTPPWIVEVRWLRL
jgi:hypothetical protein